MGTFPVVVIGASTLLGSKLSLFDIEERAVTGDALAEVTVEFPLVDALLSAFLVASFTS